MSEDAHSSRLRLDTLARELDQIETRSAEIACEVAVIAKQAGNQTIAENAANYAARIKARQDRRTQ